MLKSMILKEAYNWYLSNNPNMDSSAITVAQDNSIPIIVFSIAEKNCLIKMILMQ